MAQQPEVAENIRKRAPHVDLIFGTHNVHRLPELIALVRDSNKSVVEIWDEDGPIIEELPIKRVPGIKGYVTITYGCNNFCTYCIVPYVRGRERSRDPRDIVYETDQLGREGYLEVMLLGQNVNSYGKDLDNKLDFAELLKQINDVSGIQRIRYMTSHPKDFTDKLIKVTADLSKVCEHYHLPVQSGSNNILKKMNRGYSRDLYLELIQKVRSYVPEACFTTDIIVGFPGETEKDFEDTMDLVTQVRFDASYIFIYSPRPNTPAANMQEQVADSVKKERHKQLVKLQNTISLKKNKELEGKVLEVLVEGISKNNSLFLTSSTRANKVVNFAGSKELIGRIMPIKITKAKTWSLDGQIIPE
jgi:tRNA-2-methylthio-N6-dimethylallyladenosine synthase